MERKSFFYSHGKRIPAILNLPERRENCSAAVLCHGFLGRKEQKLLAVTARSLCKAGFIVLRFDFSGANANKPWKTMPRVSMHVRELLDALAFVRGLKRVNAKQIVLVGHSYGANICLLAAARDKGIACCVFFAPGREFQEYYYLFEGRHLKLFGHSFTVSKQARKEWMENDLREALKKVKNAVFVIAAEDDDYTPLSSAKKRFAARNAEIVVLKKADHFFKGRTRQAAELALELVEKKFKK